MGTWSLQLSFKCLRRRLLILRANAVRVSGWESIHRNSLYWWLCRAFILLQNKLFFTNVWKTSTFFLRGIWAPFEKQINFLEITSHCAAKVGVPPSVLLFQLFKCQDYKCVLPHPVSSWRTRLYLLLSLFSWLGPRHTIVPQTCQQADDGINARGLFALADSKASHFACVHGLCWMLHGWSTRNYNLPPQTTIGFISCR